QPATASSVESSSYPASAAVDGDPTTRWSSAFSDPQWITVDLGSVQNITRVRLNWENASAKSYGIQLSTDNNTWTNVYTTTNGPGSINDLATPGSGRYVRMYSTQRNTAYGDSLWEFEVYPVPQSLSISGISPVSQSVFVNPDGGLTFNVSSTITNIPTSGVQLLVNGIDVSSQLVFTGSPSNWNVSFAGLLPNQFNSATINVTDASGSFSTATVNNFDTFSQSNFMWEAEDFDFGGGQFIENPVPAAAPATNSYYQEATSAMVGVDLTTPNNISGEQFAYRNDSCGTQIASDVPRQKYVAAGVPDYNVGWWYSGAWLNYTRSIPTNNYYIYGRLASGNGAYSVTNSLVTGGAGTASQTTKVLGAFSGTGTGWQAWQWAPLLNTNGQLAVVTLGGVETLKMTSGNSVNANFYMLVPVPGSTDISVKVNNAKNTVLSFPTQAGFKYLVVYKNSLEDVNWKLLSIVTGDGTIKSVTDPANNQQRFYKLVI
ncbi:MAG TPA: discoidin domain-containing protein, partial [Candidatus Acidoferrum sp.]|nr:discoidin domain-containing protein [Candidatus Acidoferrum sp.]